MTLVARGEFSLVIAGLAVTAGFGEVGELSAAYVLILAIVGPVLARVSGQRRDRGHSRQLDRSPAGGHA